MRCRKFQYGLVIFSVFLSWTLFSFGCGSIEMQERFPKTTPRTDDKSQDASTEKGNPPSTAPGRSSHKNNDSDQVSSNSSTENYKDSISKLNNLIEASTASDVMEHLKLLASDEMEGRAPGSEGGDKAARYISSLFHNSGLSSPSELSPEYYQNFSVGTSTTQNIIGVLQGKSQSDVVILGAHYDHLGMFGSNVYYGADDNASGVSVLLYLAKELSQLKSYLQKTIIFIAFSGEESGLLGSSYYIENPVLPLKNTSLMINFDMVGYYKRGGLNFIKQGNFTKIPLNISTYCSELSLRCYEKSSSTETSDHTSFYKASIPAMLIHTGSHIYEHTFNDTVDKIDQDGILKVATTSLKIIWDLVGISPTSSNVTASPQPKQQNQIRFFNIFPSEECLNMHNSR